MTNYESVTDTSKISSGHYLEDDRKKYYAALNNANKLYLLMAQALERSLNVYLSIIPD